MTRDTLTNVTRKVQTTKETNKTPTTPEKVKITQRLVTLVIQFSALPPTSKGSVPKKDNPLILKASSLQHSTYL